MEAFLAGLEASELATLVIEGISVNRIAVGEEGDPAEGVVADLQLVFFARLPETQ